MAASFWALPLPICSSLHVLLLSGVIFSVNVQLSIFALYQDVSVVIEHSFILYIQIF